MPRLATCIAVVLLSANCSITQIIRPDEVDADPIKPDYELCEEKLISPKELSDLPDGWGVSKKAYTKVVDNNRKCIKSVGDTGIHNYETALAYQRNEGENFKRGLTYGSVGVVVIEIVLVILYLL